VADNSADRQFWKQFFEASANVSLSGYEERPDEDTVQDQTVTEESTNTTHTTLEEAASYDTPSSEHLDIDHRGEDLDLSSLTISPSHSTPRPPRQNGQRTGDDDPTTSSIPYPSPYETFGEEGNEGTSLPPVDTPVTPGRSSSRRQQDLSETPLSSPFLPPSHVKASTAKKSNNNNNNNNNNQRPTDPVLHRVLDKTYRVQATPLAKGFGRTKFAVTPKDKPTSRYAVDDSPMSSPEMEAPKLHEEIFSSPLKGQTPGTSRKRRLSNKTRITPKPGVSVLTPGKPTRKAGPWDSDDEFDDVDSEEFGVSPPKTMQFHIPHSRLMKTPGKFLFIL
jgi:DASH complex subunit ASK1